MARHSQSLFNFMKKREYLEAALERGSFWPRYHPEKLRWVAATPRTPQHIALPMVCFCDIPLQRIAAHVATYGHFGLGMSRTWGIRRGLNPVFYVSETGSLPSTFVKLRRTADTTVLEAWDDLFAFAKLLSNGSTAPDVYGESEWRFVPKNAAIAPRLYEPPETYPFREKDFSEAIENGNRATDLSGRLEFSLGDVKYIFVENDTDVEKMVSFIQSSSVLNAAHSQSDLRLLLTRITSVATLHMDY